ncbi:MAG: dihydrolipoyl dehydrogenase [Calditrichaeota bacterium]|nr:MAG: dihydrolipoyl dehydrogenase [Calditrichota bacterium]
MSENHKTHLAVIGAGPGGYTAAFLAADLGMDVTLIDPEENPGGVCLYRGCIPSKALLHVAKLIEETREAHKWGVTFAEPKIDLDKLRAFKEGVVNRLTQGNGMLRNQRKIRHLRGRGRFVSPTRLEVDLHDGRSAALDFTYAIIATGSRPFLIPGLIPDSKRIWTSTGALRMEEIPQKMLVMGGGVIGMELGSVYATLGSKVSVVEMLPGILPGADLDLVRVLQKSMAPRFETIMTETKVVAMQETSKGMRVTMERKDGSTFEETYDKVMVTIGRKPNTESIGLENLNVRINDKGFIDTDIQMRTDEPNIFAIGDVVGNPMLAHKASHEGQTAVEVIAGHKAAFEPNTIPAVVYTDPELAWCGLTETEAQAQGRRVSVFRFPWAASGRAITMDRTDGLTKLIIDPETERVLGMGVVGAGAGELIAEGVLAVEMAALAGDLKLSIHPHPTLSETVMESAEMFFGTSTHVYRPRRR